MTEENLENTYKKIRKELSSYDKKMSLKKEIIFFNKSDLLETKDIEEKLIKFKKITKTNYEIISVFSQKDIKKIKKILIKHAS